MACRSQLPAPLCSQLAQSSLSLPVVSRVQRTTRRKRRQQSATPRWGSTCPAQGHTEGPAGRTCLVVPLMGSRLGMMPASRPVLTFSLACPLPTSPQEVKARGAEVRQPCATPAVSGVCMHARYNAPLGRPALRPSEPEFSALGVCVLAGYSCQQSLDPVPPPLQGGASPKSPRSPKSPKSPRGKKK